MKRIVVLGMMAKTPVPGVIWQTLHYLLGLRRLGFEPIYVEAHARTPSMLMQRPRDDGAERAAGFIRDVLARYDLDGSWAYHALHDDDGRCLGMSEQQLMRTYRDADLILNLHGGTEPRPELTAGGRLVYLETDPVAPQIELHDGVQATADFLAAHIAHFSFAENLGTPACSLPASDRFCFLPTRQPVALDLWQGRSQDASPHITTIANWRQHWRDIRYLGERYSWSKDVEWQRFLDLPARTGATFELALSGYEPDDRERLERHGWAVRDALDLDMDAYRAYIACSAAEFTVAKDQNVRFATGWFSDRSATYLAAGRPVVTQDTGFGQVLPTGEGLFAVRDLDGAVAAVEAIRSDPRRHERAAGEIAREFFDAERVLGQLLERVDVRAARSRPARVAADARHQLGPDSTVLALIPHFKCEQWLDDCLASLCAQTRPLDGIVVIDDASGDPPVEIVSRHPGVTLLHASENVGPYRLIQQVIEDTDYDAFLFQDADDWSAPGRLEALLEGAAGSGAELIGSQEMRIFCDEPEAVPIAWPLDGNAPFRERATAFSCLHPTSLVTRDLVMELGGFASGLRFGGDAEFLRRAHWIATVTNVPYHGYLRRIRQGSLTTAPATAIGTMVRKELMEETFARANANAELIAAGRAPDLSPLRTRPPVELHQVAGPALRQAGEQAPRPARTQPSPAPTASPHMPTMVFVVGAERSGASALACALGEHPAVRNNVQGGWIGELAGQIEEARERSLAQDATVFGIAPPTPTEFAAPYLQGLVRREAAGSRHVVDAAWQHTRDVARLAELFPDARFIHIVRDVRTAVRALADPPLGSPAATGGTQVPARLRARVSEQEALERWVGSVQGCADAEAGMAAGRMLTVTHAQLVDDPAAVVERCLEFLGEQPAAQCMRPLRELRALAKPGPLDEELDPDLVARALELSARLCPTQRQPRIVLVTDHFPKVSETFFVQQFLGLLDRGWDVHLVCQRSNREHWEFFPELRERVGDRLHVARDDLERAIGELEPDLVHFGYGVLAVDRMHLARALGCRIVVSFRGFDLNSYRLEQTGAYDDVWESADMVHTVSRQLWQRAIERGCPPDRPHMVITDAVDVHQQAPERPVTAVGTPERPLRLLSIGRLHWKKGHELALAAAAMLRTRGVELEYRIIGEGEHREPTEFAVSDLGLGECVELLGARTAEQVREQLAWADLLVHPSLTEAFGVAVAEAQAMGLPVVCSDAGGLTENIEHGVTGLAVPRRDTAALADTIERLAADPVRRREMGLAARQRAETELDREVQLDRFEQLYQDLLAEKPGSDSLPLREARALHRREQVAALRERLAQAANEQGDLREQLWRREVVDMVQDYVETELPPGSRVLVVSRGDEDIVDFARHHGAHFPQSGDGRYAGHHPADSAEAIAHLSALREAGATYLVIPGTSVWWLEHYDEFACHLDQRYTRVAAKDGGYIAYALEQEEQAA
jgi:glycosyltransferase involved in cell wall biosynthesis